MGYKTMVITFDNNLDSTKALSLVAEAEPGLKKWKAETYLTDDYAVIKTKTGYRITKLYNVDPICRPEVEQ